MSMRAISLWQPWASAIALGHKTIETRSWFTKFRGPIAIHAAKRWQKEQREFAAKECELGFLPERLPFGCIVAVATLVDCVPTEDVVRVISHIEKRYGNYYSGRYAWILEGIKPIDPPIEFRGKQGFFFVPGNVQGGG